MTTRLTKNFTLEELIFSQTAIRQGINNQPDLNETLALEELCNHVLQPVRKHFGPVIVTSGFRSEVVNTAVNGKKTTSQHIKGQAADFRALTCDNYKVAEWIVTYLYFDQLILEYFTKENPRIGWIHCSYVGERNRHKVTRAFKDIYGKTQYEQYTF